MTIAEKMAQDKAYAEYCKNLAEQYAESEDIEITLKLTPEEAKKFHYLSIESEVIGDYDD